MEKKLMELLNYLQTSEYIKSYEDLKMIIDEHRGSLSKDSLIAFDSFSYGVIIGKRLEREKRKKVL